MAVRLRWVLAFVAIVGAACGSAMNEPGVAVEEPRLSTSGHGSTAEDGGVSSTVPRPSSTVAPPTVDDSSGGGRQPGACEPAPPGTDTYVVDPAWSPGDERAVEVEIRRSRHADISSTTPATVRVVDVGVGGQRMRWSSRSTTIEGAGYSELVADVVDALPPEVVEYTLRSGVVVSVDNVDDIRSNLEALNDVLIEAGVDEESMAAGSALFDSMSDEAFGRVFSERPQLFHAFEGFELTAGEPIEFDDLLPNALGGKPFPAISTVELTSVDDEDGCVALAWTTRPEPDEVLRILNESLERLAQTDEAVLSPDEVGELAIESRLRAQYDYASGALVEISAVQEIRTDSERRVDETIIREVSS